MTVECAEPPVAAVGFDAALRAMATAVIVVDGAGRVSFANPPARLLLGAVQEGAAIDAVVQAAGIVEPLVLPRGPAGSMASRLRLSDARIVNVEARRLPGAGWVLTLDDISAFIQDAELARHDALTGLANRVTLQARLKQLAEAQAPLALFYLDLDRFKAINDTLGHPVGDALLRRVAERLRSLATEGDVVARLGGDEFAVVKAGVARPEEAEVLAARVVDLIGRTYVLEGHMMNVSCSVGVVLRPADGDGGDVLLKNADLALYRAKAEGRARFRFFELSMDVRMRERRSLELDLRQALAMKELSLVYQPQIDLGSDTLVGFEALLRWQHPGRGLVSPAVFIPIAEETGLIIAIGEWVLRTACRQAAAWSRPVSIAVNLSPLQLRDSRLVNTVTAALARSGLDPARLEFEITEGALLEATEEVVGVLNQLRQLGIRVSMDDFGTGYSSLSYLQKFPFDKIKIDRSFITDMTGSQKSGAIVRAIAAIGASLGMKTTAEGVETSEQLAQLRLEGCSEVQGYLTGRPMTPADAAALAAEAHLV